MDDIDRGIIEILLVDGRASFSEIGREVGLSTNAAAARIRKLEAAGTIRGYKAVLGEGGTWGPAGTSGAGSTSGPAGTSDPAASGAGQPSDIEAFIDVRLQPDHDSDDFLAWARARTEVIDAAHVTGPYDYHLHVRVPGMPSLDVLLRALKKDAGAAQTQTRIALR